MNSKINFTEPWRILEDAKIIQSLNLELYKELSPSHPLYQTKFNAIARRQDCDDILFELEQQKNEYAVVHLTYSNYPEKYPYPRTEFYKNSEDFIQRRLQPDIQDFN